MADHDDQTIRLGLDTASAAASASELAGGLAVLQNTTATAGASVYALADEARKAEPAVYELTGSVRIASAAASGAAKEEQHLAAMLREAAAAERAAETAAAQTAAAQQKLGTAAGAAGSKVAGLGQAGLQTGRVLQDLTQGGLGGILNNIEGLSMALGGGPGLAGALTLAGVAALIATPQLKAWYAELTGSSNKVPESTDALARLTDALKKNGDELGKLRDKQSLTNAELIVYNRLSREQVELEKQKNEEAERRRELAGLEALAPKERQERAAAFKEAVGEAGGGAAAQSLLRQALENQGVERGEAIKKAEDLFIDAAKGFKDSIEEIRVTVRRNLGEKDQKLADEIQARAPEAVKRAKAGEERQKAEEKRQEEDDKLAEDLTAQGRRNEEAGRKKQEDDRAKEARERKAEDDRKNRAGVTEFQKKAADLARKVEAGALDERAALEYARLKAQGVGHDRARDLVQQGLAPQIGQAFPGANQAVAFSAAGRVVEKSAGNVDAAVAARTAELGKSGVDMNVAGQQALGEAIGAIGAVIDQNNQAAQGWNQLGAAAAGLKQAIRKGRR